MTSLTLENLTLPKEKTYFTIVLVVSILGWLLIAVTIVGILYALVIGLFLWFGNGLLIARLKSESILVNEQQLPELNETFKEVCQGLQLAKIPQLYILQSEGKLNAFATRFSGRDFVVVYSDLLEAFGPRSPEMRFFLGHEVGHLKRNHVIKHLLLFPGLLMPLIGNAYNRACEASCDRHGAFVSQDFDGAIRAMMALSGGKESYKTMDAGVFANQYYQNRGFFVSWYELISGYPTLSQRVWDLFAIKTGQAYPKTKRNPFAYLFAFFTFGGGSGATNVLITVAIIGMLAAIAVPSFVRARERAQATTVLNEARMIESAKQLYALENKKEGRTTPSWDELTRYLKPGSKMATSHGNDTLGNPFIIGDLETPPTINPGTEKALVNATGGDAFWGPYSSTAHKKHSTTPIPTTKADKGRVVIPKGWNLVTNLNENADIQIENPQKEAYFIALIEDKANFDKMTLDEYTKGRLESLVSNSENPQIVGPTQTKVKSYNALQYEIRTTSEGVKIVFLLTCVEGPQCYSQLLGWSLLSKFDQNRTEIESVTNSFEE